MENRDFRSMLQRRWDEGRNVCIGLDIEPHNLPSGVSSVWQLNQEIIRATAPYACAYKPNAAFYEANGAQGLEDLAQLMRFAHERVPEIPFIYDAKRGDNGNSNKGYITSIFKNLGFDAVTVQPYMGSEPLRPFLDWGNKGIFILSHTSNPGAREMQELRVALTRDEIESLCSGPYGQTADTSHFVIDSCGEYVYLQLYIVTALKVANHWNASGNCCVVAGATYPQELASIRRAVGDLPILIPGIGAQGGDVDVCTKHAMNSRGDGFLLSASRSITHASLGADFAGAAAEEAARINDRINAVRGSK